METNQSLLLGDFCEEVDQGNEQFLFSQVISVSTLFGCSYAQEINQQICVINELRFFRFLRRKEFFNRLCNIFISIRASNVFQYLPLKPKLCKLKKYIRHYKNNTIKNNNIIKPIQPPIQTQPGSMQSQTHPSSSVSPSPLALNSHLLQTLQMQKQQIHHLQQQNRILNSLYSKVHKKQQEIQELHGIVKKYKKYYELYEENQGVILQKNKQYERLGQENKILFGEVGKMMAEIKELQAKLMEMERGKRDFVKERQNSEIRMRGIEETFRQYQEECRAKEKELIRDLEKCYVQIKDLNLKIQDLESVKFQNEQLKAKITNISSMQMSKNNEETFQKLNSQMQENILPNKNPNPMTFQSNQNSNSNKRQNPFQKSTQKSPNKSNFFDQESAQIQRLRRQLVSKQLELQRSKALNHELSIEFDKSVSKICQFQKQLSLYRKQNHELKKTLSLFVEKQHYQKIHRSKICRESSQESQEEQEEEEDQQAGYGEREGDRSDSRR